MAGRAAGGLVDSLLADQRACWRQGTPRSVEAYPERHPSLRDDPEGLLDLAYNEIVLREEAGQSPELDEYLRRFPHLGAGLRAVFEVHRAVGEERSPLDESTLATGSGPARAASARVPASPAAS